MHTSQRSCPSVAVGLPVLWVGLLLGLLSLGACSSPSSSGTSPSQGPSQTSGRSIHRLQVAGVSRQYELFVPPGAAGPRGYPVVFGFHGAGSTIASLARASGFDTKAAQAGVAVVYPQGLGARFDTGAGSRDVQFVQAVINDLDTRIGIDRTRIHATGFSNGAFLCYRLAIRAGACRVAGLRRGREGRSNRSG